MDFLVPQSSGGTADGRRLTALTVRVFFVCRAKFERDIQLGHRGPTPVDAALDARFFLFSFGRLFLLKMG